MNGALILWLVLGFALVPVSVGLAELWVQARRVSQHRGFWYMRAEFLSRDLWVGLYWKRERHALNLYVCPLPCLVLHFTRHALTIAPEGAEQREPGERAEPLPEAPEGAVPADCEGVQCRFPFSDEAPRPPSSTPAPVEYPGDEDSDVDPMGD